MTHSIFRSAIDDGHGQVNAGYLALYWAMVGWSVSTVAILVIGACAVYGSPPDAKASALQSVGVAVGAAAGGFSTVVLAIAAYLWGDRTPHPAGPPVPATTVTVNQ